MEEDDRGRAAAGFPLRWQKKLTVDGETVGARENHLLRRHHLANRKIGWDGFGMQVADVGADADGGVRGVLRIGAEKRERAIGDRSGRPFDAVALGDRFRRAARSCDFPKMASVDIALIGIEKHFAAFGRQGNLLHFKRAGREQEWIAAGGGNGIKVRPAIGFPGKDQARSGPQNLADAGDFAEDAAGALAGAEDFAALTGFGRGDPDGPGFAGAAGLAWAAYAGGRNAHEGHAAAVGGPGRLAVVIGTRVEVAQGG